MRPCSTVCFCDRVPFPSHENGEDAPSIWLVFLNTLIRGGGGGVSEYLTCTCLNLTTQFNFFVTSKLCSNNNVLYGCSAVVSWRLLVILSKHFAVLNYLFTFYVVHSDSKSHFFWPVCGNRPRRPLNLTFQAMTNNVDYYAPILT